VPAGVGVSGFKFLAASTHAAGGADQLDRGRSHAARASVNWVDVLDFKSLLSAKGGACMSDISLRLPLPRTLISSVAAGVGRLRCRELAGQASYRQSVRW
jgi:hypothetical protein